MKFFLVWLACFLGVTFAPLSARAVGLYDVSIGLDGLMFTPTVPLVDQTNRIYLTLQNDGSKDVEGSVSFYDDTSLIGSKLFSVRASARPEEVWMNWRPTVLGPHRLRIVVENEDSYTDARPENNVLVTSVLVDRDSDGDSVPDSQDQDRDNDQILNADEATRGTNPDRRDTDGDGIDDRTDYYPLDGRRSVRETPRPVTPTTTRVTTPTPPTPRTAVSPTRPASSTSGLSAGTSSSLNGIQPILPTPTTTLVETPLPETTIVQENSSTDTLSGMESVDPLDAQERFPWFFWLILVAIVTGIVGFGFAWLSYRRD